MNSELYLLAGNLAARNPPGICVTMYPQKKEESTTPIVSGVQSNSLCVKESTTVRNGKRCEKKG